MSQNVLSLLKDHTEGGKYTVTQKSYLFNWEVFMTLSKNTHISHSDLHINFKIWQYIGGSGVFRTAHLN